MEALKLETLQPEPHGRVGYTSAGRPSAASVARGSGDGRYADLPASRTKTSPQPRGSAGHGDADATGGWLRDLEKLRSRLSRVAVGDDEVSGVTESTLSGPAAPDDAVRTDSTPARVETPAPASPTGGAPGGGEGPLGSCGTARLRCTPGREQVRLCELGSVKNGWLPIHKRALLFGFPLHARDAENPPRQEKMKAYIAVTTPRGYTKKWNGNGYIDGNQAEKCAPPTSFRGLRSPSHPNINQASSCRDTLDRDGQRGMYEEKRTNRPQRSGFVQSNGSSRVDGGVASCWGSPLQRTLSTPGLSCPEDTAHKNPPKTKASFSSITITARRVPQTASVPSRSSPHPDCMSRAGGPMTQAQRPMTQAQGPVTWAEGPMTQAGGPVTQAGGPMTQAWGPVTQASKANPAMTPTKLCTVTSGDREPVVLRKKPVIIKVTEHQEAYRPGERPIAARPPEFRHSYSEGDCKRNALSGSLGSLLDTRAESVQSRALLDLPASSTNSNLYLDKSLSVSLLEQPESTRRVHRSTLSLYLSAPAPPAAKEGPDGPRRAVSSQNLSCSRPSPAPLGDARETPPEAARRGGKPGEPPRPRRGRSETRLPARSQPQERVAHKGLGEIFASSPDPVIADMKQRRQNMPKSTTALAYRSLPDAALAPGQDAGMRSQSPRVEGMVRRGPRRAVYESGPPGPCSWTGSFPVSQDSTSNSLTLREALELHRPDFISRSRGRVKQLEERAQKRRADQNSDPALELSRGRRRRRNCTKPDPLSDNLFRPRERSISRKDMQLRSKRIYNKLPEVTRKKEEEKKKVLSQTNRLRAEIFKKKLLDQILQRNSD